MIECNPGWLPSTAYKTLSWARPTSSALAEPTDRFVERTFQPAQLVAPQVLEAAPSEAPLAAPREEPVNRQLRLLSKAPTPELASRAWELVNGEPKPGEELFSTVFSWDGETLGLAVEAARWGAPPMDPLGHEDPLVAHAQASELDRWVRAPSDREQFWSPVLDRLLETPANEELARGLAGTGSRLLYDNRAEGLRVIPYLEKSLPQAAWTLELARSWGEAVGPAQSMRVCSALLRYPEREPSVTDLEGLFRTVSGDLDGRSRKSLARVVFGQMAAMSQDRYFNAYFPAHALSLAKEGPEGWRFLVDTLQDGPMGPTAKLLDACHEALSDGGRLQTEFRSQAAGLLSRRGDTPEARLALLQEVAHKLPAGRYHREFVDRALESLAAGDEPGVEVRLARSLLPQQPSIQVGQPLPRFKPWGPPELVAGLLARARARIGGEAPWEAWDAKCMRQLVSQQDLEGVLDEVQTGALEPYLERRRETELTAAALTGAAAGQLGHLAGKLFLAGIRAPRTRT